MNIPVYIRAHEASSCHRQALMNSRWCGCFYCLAVFEPAAIEEWIDRDDTALCPVCGIDSVLGSASGFPIEREFLKKMQQHWFGEGAPDEEGMRHLQEAAQQILKKNK